jgi:hypothetical protein
LQSKERNFSFCRYSLVEEKKKKKKIIKKEEEKIREEEEEKERRSCLLFLVHMSYGIYMCLNRRIRQVIIEL